MSQLEYSGPIQIYLVEECQYTLLEALNNTKLLESPFLQKGCQNVVDFNANQYFRTKFPIVQPQLFYIHLWWIKIVGNIFLIQDYLLISIFNSIYALLISVVFYGIARKIKISQPIIFSLVAGWSNPILILNGNIQLYQDSFLILLICLGFYVGLMGRFKAAILIYGMSLIFKPTVLFLLPLMFYFYRFNVILLPIPFIITLLIHYLNGSFVGYSVSILSITDTMGASGAEALGFFKLMDAVIYIIGDSDYKFLIKNIIFTSKIFSVLIAGFIIIKSFFIKSNINTIYCTREYLDGILLLSIMLMFFRFGSQVNHWLILFPFMMIGLFVSGHRKIILILLSILFLQDLIYGGIYRGSGLSYLTRYNQYIYFLLTLLTVYILLSWYKSIFLANRSIIFKLGKL